MGIEVRRGAERAVTRTHGRETRHSFSFGPHYDAANTSFGLLVACNEDRLQPGAGYGLHPHRDLEIVTWVLSGSLLHEDDSGGRSVLRPGAVQRMTAGRGVVHSETHDASRLGGGPPSGEPVHLVQTWLVPDRAGLDPSYAQGEVALETGRLLPLASGRPGQDAAVRLAQRDATLHAARLDPGDAVQLPAAPYVHLLVTRGSVELVGAARLGQGDEARCLAAGPLRVTAAGPAEVLVWEMHAHV